MDKISKCLAFLLTIIVAVSCLTLTAVKPAAAQSLPTPSVPEFTVRLVNNSYSIPQTITTATDPYTGKQTTQLTPSQYVKDEYIEVQIKHQAFTPYTINYQNIDNRTVNLYFYVVSKGHYSTDWSTVDEATTIIENYSSQYTTIKLYTDKTIPAPAELDFRAKAMIGYLVHQYEPEKPLPPPNFPTYNYGINGTSSDWSPTQTISTGESSNSPASTPTVPELSWLVIVPLLLSVLAIALLLKQKRAING
jgi:hypothetical protein